MSSTNGMIWIFVVFVVLIELVCWILKVFPFDPSHFAFSYHCFVSIFLAAFFNLFDSVQYVFNETWSIYNFFLRWPLCWEMPSAVTVQDFFRLNILIRVSTRLLCCVVGQNILLSQCFSPSPPSCINVFWRMVKETWEMSCGMVGRGKGLGETFDHHPLRPLGPLSSSANSCFPLNSYAWCYHFFFS